MTWQESLMAWNVNAFVSLVVIAITAIVVFLFLLLLGFVFLGFLKLVILAWQYFHPEPSAQEDDTETPDQAQLTQSTANVADDININLRKENPT